MTVAVVAFGVVGFVAIGVLGDVGASYAIALAGGAALVIALLVAACVGIVGFVKSRRRHSQKGMWMSAAPFLLLLLALIAPRL